MAVKIGEVMRVHVSTSSGPGGERVSGSITWSLLMVRASSLWLHWAASINCSGGGRKPGGEGRRAQFGCFPLHIQHLFLALWKPLWARRHPAVPMAIPVAHPIDHCAPYVNHPRAAILIIIALFRGGGAWGGDSNIREGTRASLCVFSSLPY